jgi:hypothetical protein
MPLVSVDAETIPMVHTENVSGLVSDSGITRYRMDAKIWDIYSNKGDGYWYFPKGIHVEQFDSLYQAIGSIVADTAYHFEKKGLWRAIGNVVVKNMEGKTFETSELFWDQRVPANSNRAFYTTQSVKITNPDGTYMYGTNGFKSDQSLNSIFLFMGKGEINVEESSDTLRQNPKNRQDSIPQHP